GGQRGGGRGGGPAGGAAGGAAPGGGVRFVFWGGRGGGRWFARGAGGGGVCLLGRVNRHYRRIAAQIGTIEPLEPPGLENPIVVLPAGGWSKLMQQGLKFALRLSPDVHVVQVKTDTDSIEDLADNWDLLIASRARAAGL